MKATVYHGAGLQYLREHPEGLVLTDCPKSHIHRCLVLCESLGLQFLNYYGELEKGKFPGEKVMLPYAKIIEALMPELVVDPFMGSGTTGLACIHHGIDFVGVEIDERRARYAYQRLQNAAARADTVEFRHVPDSIIETVPV